MSTNEPILTISIASSLLRLHPRTVMLYEKSGFLAPYRTTTNRRLFSVKNLEDLQFIKYLNQTEGVNLQGVRVVLQAIKLSNEKGVDLKGILFPNFKVEILV